MTDDIVTRLREKYLGQLPICLEAADEIEELRKDLSWQARCIGRHYGQFADLRNEIEHLRAEVAYWKHQTEQLARYIKRHNDVPNKNCRCIACKILRGLEKGKENE